LDQHFNKAELMDRIDGDREVLELLLKELKSSFPAMLAELRTSLERENSQALRKSAHLIKGAALNLSLEILARIAQSLENQAVDSPQVPPLVQALEEEWQLIQREILPSL